MWKTLLLNLPQQSYAESLDLMRALVALKRSVEYPQVLILVEHEPVVTLGRRSGEEAFKVSEGCLIQRGVGIHRIERGGLATFHGPGQLVAYPIFDLARMKIGIVQLVSGLEQAVIDTLAELDIEGRQRSGYRGVWVKDEKIASVGIAVRRSISFHGIALNNAPDLACFDLIHPCGIPDVRMTSIAKLLNRMVDDCKIRQTLTKSLANRFDLACDSVTLNRLRSDISMHI